MAHSINGNVLGLCTVDDFSPWEHFKLDEHSFVIDAGARGGEFSKYILDTYNCRVDAYEPGTQCDIVHPKFRLIQKAIWDGSDMRFTAGGSGANIFGDGDIIHTIDIIDITKEHINLIKMNIEGAEMEVLRRANLNNVDQLLVEFHAFLGFTTEEEVESLVDRIVMEYGYKYKKLGNAPTYFFYDKN